MSSHAVLDIVRWPFDTAECKSRTSQFQKEKSNINRYIAKDYNLEKAGSATATRMIS